VKGDAASGLACAARWGRSGRGVGAGRVLGAGVAALGRGWAGRGRAGWAGTWAAGWRAGMGLGVLGLFFLFYFYFYSIINKV